jgi:hypothetical protein
LFQVEVKIGHILRRLSFYDESAQYFHYAAGLINVEQYIDPEQTDVLEALAEADRAYRQGEFWEASRQFDYVFQEASYVFPYETVFVFRGDSFVHLSFRYGSTMEAFRELNSLVDATEARVDEEILVPYLDEAE